MPMDINCKIAKKVCIFVTDFDVPGGYAFQKHCLNRESGENPEQSPLL